MLLHWLQAVTRASRDLRFASYAQPIKLNLVALLPDRYRRVRRFLPAVLRQVPFQATPSGQPVPETRRIISPSRDRHLYICING